MAAKQSVGATRRRVVLPAQAFQMMLQLVMVLLGLSLTVRADDFWKRKPTNQWSLAEALKLVRRSPWAKLEVVAFHEGETQAAFSIPTGTNHCDPDAINQNGNCLQRGRIEAPVDSSRQTDAAPTLKPSAGVLVRWESATPIALAFARLEELGEGGTATFQCPPPRLPPDRYVITVRLEHPAWKGFELFAVPPAGKPVLVATLKTRRGIVAPREVEFTGIGATSSAHYYFPRTLDGAPLLAPARDWAEFTLLGVGFTVHSKFTLEPDSLDPADPQRKL